MIVLGLTGSVAMGKTTVAGLFRDEGVPVHDADAAVHRLMEPGGAAFGPVGDAFPDCAGRDGIDRDALGRRVFDDPGARGRLESILHPLVRADRDEWLGEQRGKGAALAVLDIPLLYETGSDAGCDAVVVVSASRRRQRRRAMGRPGMTAEKLDGILEAQMDDAEKRRRADYVVPTGFGVGVSRWCVKRIVKQLSGRVPGRAEDG